MNSEKSQNEQAYSLTCHNRLYIKLEIIVYEVNISEDTKNRRQ